MTDTLKIRAREGQLLGQMIRFGEGQFQLFESGPRPTYLITLQEGQQAEVIIGTADSLQAAQETADNLTAEMRALIDTDAPGRRMVAKEWGTLQ